MSSAYSSPLFMLPTHTPQISSYSCPCICHLCEFSASCWDKNINIVIHHSVSLVFLIISNKEILIQNHLWTPFPPPPPRHPWVLLWLRADIFLPSLYRCHLTVSPVFLPMLLFHLRCHFKRGMSSCFAYFNNTSYYLEGDCQMPCTC